MGFDLGLDVRVAELIQMRKPAHFLTHALPGCAKLVGGSSLGADHDLNFRTSRERQSGQSNFTLRSYNGGRLE
jgi:hypothetical protein